MSAAAPSYRISDEPRPGALSRLVVDPFWPLLAAMLAGSWLALPWFAVNSAAVGSPTRRRELAWLALGLLGSVAGALGLLFTYREVPRWAARSLLVVLVAWRLGVAYVVYELQRGPVELFRWHGGVARTGLLAIVAGYLLEPRLRAVLPGDLWRALFDLVLG